MNKQTAWNIDVDLRARRAAEQAAHEAGISLEDWINEAIVERALGARDDEHESSSALDRWRGSFFLHHGPWGRTKMPPSVHDSEDLIEATAERIERCVALSEQRTQRAFESIAVMLGQKGVNRERGGWNESAIREPQSPWFPNRSAPKAGTGNNESRIAVSLHPAEKPKSAQAREKPRLDLKAAISQIALRRQQLSAREAGVRPPSPTPESVTETSHVASPADALRDEIQALASSLDELRRDQAEQRVSAADVSAMRAEIAAMTRSLADLAPRNAVVGLEGAVRDLTQRVALLRQNGHAEQLLAPLDAVAAELRATLKAHDPQAIAASLEREIRAIGGKIDSLSEAAINPESFERIRRQTEEVRDLLAAAAMRAAPLERLERRIGDLADRVEGLGASPVPHFESLQMAVSLGDLRREIERSTPLTALVSIERRLELIATRLDQEIARPPPAPDTQSFEDLARRIDDLRQSLESSPQPRVDTSGLEASLKELNAKLESPTPEPLAAMMRDINAKVDAERDADIRGIEPLLAGIAEKLDHLEQQQASGLAIKLSPIENALQSLNAKFDLGGAATFDRHTIEKIADEAARRLSDGNAGQDYALVLAEHIAGIHTRLDSLSGQLVEAGGTVVREPLDGLRESITSAVVKDLHNETPAGLSVDLAQIRAEQASAERRTQARLGGVQDLLETLVARFVNIESQFSSDARGEPKSQGAATPLRKDMASALRGVAGPDVEGSTVLGPVVRAFRPQHPSKEGETYPAPSAEDLLLEPGVGSPQHARELAQAIGSKTNPAVSVHIAAARRAAQAALADRGASAPGSTASASVRVAARSVKHARMLYANHRRSVLVVVALAIVATVAARVVAVHAPFLQKSETLGGPVKTAGTESSPAPPPAVPSAGVPAAPSVDTTPTASIAPTSDPRKAGSADQLSSPELLAAIPAGLPPTLREAIVAGTPRAQYELALRLFEGRGLPLDQRAAALWFERAAAAGLAPAQFRIASLYEKGVGVARDETVAKRWYLKAAEAGNARAAHNLAVMYAEPAGEKPDYTQAVKWFRRAGEMGVRDSQFNLAVLYARGLGVEQDLRQSWMWFSLAAMQGDADAAKKRDDVAAKMDPSALAAAADALAKFKVVKSDPVANEVAAPPGGWDT
jgi:localization factor PodJL